MGEVKEVITIRMSCSERSRLRDAIRIVNDGRVVKNKVSMNKVCLDQFMIWVEGIEREVGYVDRCTRHGTPTQPILYEPL